MRLNARSTTAGGSSGTRAKRMPCGGTPVMPSRPSRRRGTAKVRSGSHAPDSGALGTWPRWRRRSATTPRVGRDSDARRSRVPGPVAAGSFAADRRGPLPRRARDRAAAPIAGMNAEGRPSARATRARTAAALACAPACATGSGTATHRPTDPKRRVPDRPHRWTPSGDERLSAFIPPAVDRTRAPDRHATRWRPCHTKRGVVFTARVRSYINLAREPGFRKMRV